jgi:hypothetical protein
MNIFILDDEFTEETLLSNLPGACWIASPSASGIKVRVLPELNNASTGGLPNWRSKLIRSALDVDTLLRQRDIRAQQIWELAGKKYPGKSAHAIACRMATFGIEENMSYKDFLSSQPIFVCNGGYIDGCYIDGRGKLLDEAVLNTAANTVLRCVEVYP